MNSWKEILLKISGRVFGKGELEWVGNIGSDGYFRLFLVNWVFWGGIMISYYSV